MLKQAFIHLRFHFSLLLLPVFLFSASQAPVISPTKFWLVFVILHVLLYPASNAFNSYYDDDKGSIGGLKNPPPTNGYVLLLANVFDVLALTASFFLMGLTFFGFICIYILFSRIYSYRPIRLKRFALPSFLIIFLFQGGLTFFFILFELQADLSLQDSGIWWAVSAASFQIGAMYPLTQIYQHNSDEMDGVKTLSARLGYMRTFIFSGVFFILATLCYFLYFRSMGDLWLFYLLMIFQLPIVLYFIRWMLKVRRDESEANYSNTMKINIITAVCMNSFFGYLLIQSTWLH
ncbi:MAG: 1,4-dihydroxy-2-naphthoate octaprenyltransferase [Bacteroidia bacterium]